jgi:hypothetical protein
MPTTIKRRSHKRTTRKNPHKKGGKSFALVEPVKLVIQNNQGNIFDVPCDVCKNNNYNEVLGSIGKSKLRSGFGQVMFGDAADILDTTSVILYFCNFCGNCRIIRNKDPLRILAVPISTT